MRPVVEYRGVTKRFGDRVALEEIGLSIPRQSIVGVVGRNGSGKSTLIRHAVGLYLPDRGDCITLERVTRELGRGELSRIGLVDQHSGLLPALRGDQLLRYVSAFYETWDRQLEARLVKELELDLSERTSAMSPGNRQKLALVAATCHRPELLLLDEPLSDLDPLARQSMIMLLLERFSSDDVTMVISSHMLRDIEPVVNRIVCLEGGRLVADDELDTLRERYAEWLVTSSAGRLPATWAEPYIVSARGDHHQAQLVVRDAERHAGSFCAVHDAQIESRPLNLERIFPLLVGGADADAVRVERAGAAV